MLWIMFAVFMIGYTPGTYNTMSRAGRYYKLPKISNDPNVTHILNDFMYLVSGINPIVYIAMSK